MGSEFEPDGNTSLPTMTALDRFLQQSRIHQAKAFLRPGMRVLDVGCSRGELFERVSGLAPDSLGIEPTLSKAVQMERVRLLPGFFPQDIPAGAGLFDAISMLAVLEHFPESAYGELGRACLRFLKRSGLLVITVPSPAVDHILAVLKTFRLVHGMSLEEHHGYDIRDTRKIFSAPDFELICRQKFQFGLNNLFVFRRMC